METHDNENRYVTFPLSEVHVSVQESIASHEDEICEPINDECILPDNLNDVTVAAVDGAMNEAQVDMLAEHSDNEQEEEEEMVRQVEVGEEDEDVDDEEEKSLVYPIYIKEEEHQQHQYTSGDDESMAVEALRQLGGMYTSSFVEIKKHRCPKCSRSIDQSELVDHAKTCTAVKLHSCATCGENFERKQDYDNHIVCHQVDRPHSCRTCGNLFRSKANLQTHMTQVHKMEKPHKCAICGSDFHRPSSLSNHMKIHTYVAGRALLAQQSSQSESGRKWPNEQDSLDSSTSTGPSATTYEVQWSVPYNFTNDNVDGLPVNSEKIDALQEFTVMPNGEVAQFEYGAQDPLTSPMSEQYDITMSDYSQTNDTGVKAETLTFTTTTTTSGESSRNYVEISVDRDTIKTHVCAYCGAIFSRATALASHEKIHATSSKSSSINNWAMPVECEYCDKQFQDAPHLAAHQTTCARKLMRCGGGADGEAGGAAGGGGGGGKWGKHACPECGKKFTTKQKMFRHQWIHRKKTHSCEICGVQFEKQNELDEHRLSAHPGDSPFTCAECGKSFVSRQGLWEHGRTHAGSPAHFHCDTCSKTFSSRQGYLIHNRTHTGERPYGCKFCWKAFRDGGTLRKHERIHTGERPHVCPLCSRAFNQKVVLREHVRWVHAAGKNETEVIGPPYPCPLCGSLNQDRDELCAHIVKHSDQMIAEAKAKTNNNAGRVRNTTAKSKRSRGATTTTSKRSAATAESAEVTEVITKSEETVALASITENNDEDTPGDSMIVDGEKNDNVRGDDDDNDTSKVHDLVIEQEVLRIVQKRNDTLCLVANDRASNTLHFITKQNESLPVLAIRNPQSHENFSCQIDSELGDSDGQMRQDDIADGADNCLIDQDPSNVVSVEQVTRFIQESTNPSDDEDEDDEMVCGICGDDFNDKNVLMEHVKIHI